jgi:paraquat-inducible protein B
MQIPIAQELDPFAALRWGNLLDDVNEAHNKMDAHLEYSDEWHHEFEVRMLTHKKMATIMYHTLNELKELTAIQQARITELEVQIEELQHYQQMPVISDKSLSIAKI